MTAASRRKRLLRLRTIEHRVAAVRQATAAAAHDSIENVARRVAHLRTGTGVRAGASSGQVLQSLAELAHRLDAADVQLAASRAAARAVRELREAERSAAHIAEERVGRLHERAARSEQDARDAQRAAALPLRLRKVRQ